MKNTGRCYVQDIHGGPTSAALEDAIRSADIKLKECVERRERLLAELRCLESAITYQEATKAKLKAELAALLAPGEIGFGGDLKQKMLDDLVAQRAAITRKIGELEAECAC